MRHKPSNRHKRQIVTVSHPAYGPHFSYAKAPPIREGREKEEEEFFYSIYSSKPYGAGVISVERPAAGLSALLQDIPAVRVPVLAGAVS